MQLHLIKDGISTDIRLRLVQVSSGARQLCWKCSQMISRIYRILLGEEDLPTSERSVFYKNKSYTDKVYNKAIDDMIKDIDR